MKSRKSSEALFPMAKTLRRQMIDRLYDQQPASVRDRLLNMASWHEKEAKRLRNQAAKDEKFTKGSKIARS